MRWKNWPYWLRGGIIALLVIIILVLIGFKFSIFIVGFIPGYIILTFFGPILQDFFPTLFSTGDNWFYYLLGVIISLIIGAIIGIIIRKIKSRKNEIKSS